MTEQQTIRLNTKKLTIGRTVRRWMLLLIVLALAASLAATALQPSHHFSFLPQYKETVL